MQIQESQEASGTIDVDHIEWEVIRARRNRLLAETDHTQLQDSPLTEAQKTASTEYRQQLRNLPQKYRLFSALVWPVKPEL
jgi:hypothetical protein